MSRIEDALARVECGEATVYDAEVLRQALAVKAVEVVSLRQKLDEALRRIERLEREMEAEK